MPSPLVLEGTWEELKSHDEELAGKRFRLILVLPEIDDVASKVSKSKRRAARKPGDHTPRQLTGMGKFAGIIPSSQEFMRQKQEEIELEERKFPR